MKYLFKLAVVASALFALVLILTCCSKDDKNKETTGISASSTTQATQTSDVTTTQTTTKETTATQPSSTTESTENAEITTEYNNDNKRTDTYVILNNESTTIKGEGVSFENGVLAISQGGTYSLQGTLTNGKIYVNSPDEDEKVRIILNGVSVSCSTDAPLFIEKSPKETILILTEGTVNSFSDTSREFADEDEKGFLNSVIYSKSDLTIDGKGTLNINAHFEKAVFSDKHINIKNGLINIESVTDGIIGKQGVTIDNGTINITCCGEGICTAKKSSKKIDDITISNGVISVYSERSCIFSATDINISGGTFNLVSGGGCVGIAEDKNSSEDEDNDFFDFLDNEKDDHVSEPKRKPFGKGIKCDGTLTVDGGAFNISSAGDSIHAAEICLSESRFNLASDEVALHSESDISTQNTDINIVYSKEDFRSFHMEILDD